MKFQVSVDLIRFYVFYGPDWYKILYYIVIISMKYGQNSLILCLGYFEESQNVFDSKWQNKQRLQ